MAFESPAADTEKNKAWFYQEAFSRNIGLLSEPEQAVLHSARVAIPGMGGVGGTHLITLVRSGVGKFHLADFDVFEAANVNRQYGARLPDFGKPKIDVMAAEALSINPYLEIKTFPKGINASNVDDFLDGVEVVIDGLDFFSFDIRRLLFKRARDKGVYVITAGPMGFSSALLIFSPHTGMGFDEYFHINDAMSEQEKLLSFALGLAPRATHVRYMDFSKIDLDAQKGPSSSIACQLCSAVAATETLRILLKRGNIKPVPYYFQFDAYLHTYCRGYLLAGNRNPMQRFKGAYVRWKLRQGKAREPVRAPELPHSAATSDNIPEEVVHYLIKAGIQAPSGDNAQPWQFSWHHNRLTLYLDRQADPSFFNVHQLASVLSCGAVLENVRLAATACGLEARITYMPSTGHRDVMAHVELSTTRRPKDPLHDAIWDRCTNRKPYVQQPILPTVFEQLDNCVAAFPGAKLHVLTQPGALRNIARVVYKVDRMRTEHQALHAHLVHMLRCTPQEALETRDGLPLKTLEAGLAGEMFLKLTRPWVVMEAANAIGIGRLVPLHAYRAILHSGAVALLTVGSMESEDFLKGGQLLQRLWLTLTQQGLAMQPMTAVTLFWLRWQLEGATAFLSKHRALLQQVWHEYQEVFQEVDFATAGHVMLFRLGYGAPVQYRTYRKEVESFVLAKPPES